MTVGEAQRAAGTRAGALAAARRRRLRLDLGDWGVRIGSVLFVLAVWEFVAPRFNPLIIRPPTHIFRAFGELIANGELQEALGQSLREFSGGLVIALTLGILLGIASGRYRFVYNAIDPLVSALYSVPSVALVPLIAVAFKFQGDAPRIATVALFAIFPILINTQQGVRNVDRGLLEVAKAFNTSERRLWTDVIMPSAVPFLLAGVRLAIGRALIGMIVSEFLVGLVGLGYLIIVYENVNFGGRSKVLGVGAYRFFTPADFNDVISSIKVPAGLAAVVYADADEGGGYGSWVDLLEDWPDLSKINFNEKISYINVFSTTTSAVATIRRTTSTACGVLRSRTRLFFPALSCPKLVLAPLRSGGRVRIMSPSGASILITSAPRSARSRVQCGPAIVVVKSSTRRRSKAPVIISS